MTTSTKNRRLRKKLYLDEFAVMGFDFSCKLNAESGLDPEQFFDTLIDFIDGQELMIDIGGSKLEFVGYVTTAARYGSATEANRTDLTALLNSIPGVEDVVISEMTDAYYGM